MRLSVHKALTRIFLLCLLLPLTAEAQEKNSTVVFRNVTLIDMRREQSQLHITVVISGNKISKIGRNVKIPKDDELEFLVQARFMSFEALQTATVNPAKFLDSEKSLGTIETGKLADLILLDANPLLDISNTRKINSVVANGRFLDRKTLDEMLNNVEAAAKKR